MQRVLVLGLGLSGRSAAQFLLNRQAFVVGFDSNSDLAKHEQICRLSKQGMIFEHVESLIVIETFDLLVVSPGISPNHPLYVKALESGIKVIGEAELACQEIQKKCLGVTGTNGKTTVTLLTTHILNQSGIKAKALGNIGVPLTSALDETISNDDTEVFVIELSSFQLETLMSRFLDAGVILNITPDHLDRYASMNAYAAAKAGMEKNIKEGGILFIEDKCFKQYGSLFTKDHLCYGYSIGNALFADHENFYWEGTKMFSFPEIHCTKHVHDRENLLASFALCKTLGVSTEKFLIAVNTFQKPPHRIEFVRTVNGVHYYDDSKGTNIDAVARAIESMEGKVILIAGGVDKGFPYSSWIKSFAGKVKAICAIGQSKKKIQFELGQSIPVSVFEGMEEAISHAARLAQPGENVLLSPGCSSFDMFKDYEHRGQEFKRIVELI